MSKGGCTLSDCIFADQMYDFAISSFTGSKKNGNNLNILNFRSTFLPRLKIKKILTLLQAVPKKESLCQVKTENVNKSKKATVKQRNL